MIGIPVMTCDGLAAGIGFYPLRRRMAQDLSAKPAQASDGRVNRRLGPHGNHGGKRRAGTVTPLPNQTGAP